MRFMRQPMAMLLSVLLAITPLLPAQAAMLGNDQVITPAESAQAGDRLEFFLTQEATRQQLLSWGVNPESVLERAASLSDTELARINQAIDQHAGGDSVLGILLIIFIVFIITDAIGATDIFPFVHPVR